MAEAMVETMQQLQVLHALLLASPKPVGRGKQQSQESEACLMFL